MRNNIARTVLGIVFFATFMLSMVPAVQAAQCSNGGIAGDWGFTSNGTVVLAAGTIPFGAVGRLTFDVAGNIVGTETASINGHVAPETIKGTITMHPDCRATATVDVFEGTTLVRTTKLSSIFVVNQTEFRAIFTSVTTPSGTLSTVITLEGNRLF